MCWYAYLSTCIYFLVSCYQAKTFTCSFSSYVYRWLSTTIAWQMEIHHLTLQTSVVLCQSASDTYTMKSDFIHQCVRTETGEDVDVHSETLWWTVTSVFMNLRQCVPSVLLYGRSCVLPHHCSRWCFPPLLLTWISNCVTLQRKPSPVTTNIDPCARLKAPLSPHHMSIAKLFQPHMHKTTLAD